MKKREMQQGDKFGKYEIIKKLGEGGYAEVYLARDPTLDRKVALKILRRKWIYEVGFVDRFEEEALATADFDHPNILKVYERDAIEEQVFIAVEYAAGGNLADRLTKNPDNKLSIEQALEFIQHVASALDYAHERNVIHRDIKPSNILIKRHSNQDIAILSDFGLAKAAQENSFSNETTSNTAIVGTGPYMSPEQFTGRVDHRSDVYALGIMTYELLSGAPPFLNDAFPVLFNAITHELPPSLVDSGIPAEIDRVILQALEKEPDARYDSAGAFATALETAVRYWRNESNIFNTLITLRGMMISAKDNNQWQLVAQHCREILVIQPDDKTANETLLVAKREIDVANLREQAREREANENWEDAATIWGELLTIVPNDTTFQERLEHAHQQKQLHTWYMQATTALNQNDVDTAISQTEKVIKEAPEYRDAKVLLRNARKTKVSVLREDAIMAVGKRDASAATMALDEINRLDPDGIFVTKRALTEIQSLIANIQQEESKKVQEKRRRQLLIGALVALALFACVIGSSAFFFMQDGGRVVENDSVESPTAVFIAQTDDDNSAGDNSPEPTETMPPSPTATNTATPIPTSTTEPTVTATATETSTPTPTHTATPVPTLTNTPTSIPTNTPESGDPGVVAKRNANIYSGPSDSGNPLDVLQQGRSAEILGKNGTGRWLLIETEAGVQGWVWHELVSQQGDLSLVVVVTPVTSPSPLVPETPVESDGPLLIQAAWPIGNAKCDGGQGFTVDFWIEPKGGTGSYIITLPGVTENQSISGGVTLQMIVPSGTYVNELTVQSGSDVVTQEVYVSRDQLTCG